MCALMEAQADLIAKIHDFRIAELRQFLRFGNATGFSTLRKDDLMVQAVALLRRNVDDCEYRVKVVELYKIRWHKRYNIDDIRHEVLTTMTANNSAQSPMPVEGSPEEVCDPAPVTPTTDPEEDGINDTSTDAGAPMVVAEEEPAVIRGAPGVTALPPRSSSAKTMIVATSSAASEITSEARVVCHSSTDEVPSTSANQFPRRLDAPPMDSGVSLEKDISILMIDDGAEESSSSVDSVDVGVGVPGMSMGARNSSDSETSCESESRRRLRAIIAHPDASAENLNPDRTVHRTWPTFLGKQIKDLPTLQFQSHMIGPKAMNFFGGSYYCTTNVLLFDYVKQQLREDGYDVVIRFLNPKAMSDEVPYRGANVDPNLALNVFYNSSHLGRVVITNIGSQDYPIRIKRFLIDHARFHSVAFGFQVTVTGEYCEYYKKDPLIMTISFVKEIPADLLFEELLTFSILPQDKSLDMIRKKFTPESDEDVAVTRLEVSLKCPLSCCRIEVPAKGADCDHIDCFDCRTYLQLHVCSQAWVCPICRKVTPYDKLVVDKFMSQVLLDAVPSISDIRLYADGTWKSATDRKSLAPVVHAKKANLVFADCIDIDSGPLNETICLDDTVDEEVKKDDSDMFANLGTSNFITPPAMQEGNGCILMERPRLIAGRELTPFARTQATPSPSLQINSSAVTGNHPSVSNGSGSSISASSSSTNPNCNQQTHFGGAVVAGMNNFQDRVGILVAEEAAASQRRRGGGAGGNFGNYRPIINELNRFRPSGRSPLYTDRPQSRETLGFNNNNNNNWSTTVSSGLGSAGNATSASNIYRNNSYNNNRNTAGANYNGNYGNCNNQNYVASTLVHYRGGNNRARAGWGGYGWENNVIRNGVPENFNPVPTNRIPNFW